MRKNLKFSAIVGFVLGFIYLITGMSGFIGSITAAIVVLLVSVYNYTCSEYETEKLRSKKTWLIFFAAITIFANPISSIITLIAVSQLDNLKNDDFRAPPKKKVEPIFYVLVLGLGMICLSGIILISTSWNTIPDVAKTLVLLLIGLILIIISGKLNKSSETFTGALYVVGMFFIGLSYYSIGLYKLLGSNLAIDGDQSQLFFASFIYVCALLFYFIYKKFDNKKIFDITFILYIIGTVELVKFLNLPVLMILLAINVALLVLNLANKKQNKYLKLFTYVLGFELLIATSNSSLLDSILSGGNLLVIILNLLSFTKKKMGRYEQFLAPLLIIGNSLVFISELSNSVSINAVIFTAIIAVVYCYSMIEKTYKKNKLLFIVESILYNSVMFLCFSYTVGKDIYSCCAVAAVILFVNVMYFLVANKKCTFKFEYYLQPFKLMLGILAFFNIVNNYVDASFSYILVACYLVSILMYMFIKETKLKFIYFEMFITLLALSFIFCLSNELAILSIINIISLLCLYNYTLVSKDLFIKSLRYAVFTISIIMIYVTFVFINVLDLIPVLQGILPLIIYAIMMIKTRKKLEYNILSIVVVAPIAHIINNLDVGILIEIPRAIERLYVIWALCRLLFKDVKVNNLISIVFSALVLLPLVFMGDSIINLFVCVVALLFIIRGLVNAKYDSFTYYGIGLTLLNLIVALKDIWASIPFYLYLLIGGILFVSIYYVKESKKK